MTLEIYRQNAQGKQETVTVRFVRDYKCCNVQEDKFDLLMFRCGYVAHYMHNVTGFNVI